MARGREAEEDEEEHQGEKFTSDSDLKHGPVTNRGCTDPLCLIIFIAHIIAFWVLSFLYAGEDSANAAHLYKPRDFQGGYCSLDPLESHEYMIFTLNVTKAVDSAAESALCSPGWSQWEAALTALGVEQATYEAACGAASSSISVDAAMTGARSTLEEYTTYDGVSKLLEAGSVLSSITTWFTQVCVTQCGIDFTSTSGSNVSGIANGRSYVYKPSADRKWATVWNTVVGSSSGQGSELASVFTFQALSEASCPYDAKHCVPLPGVSFTELAEGYCTFQIDTGSFGDMISSAAGDTFNAIADSSVAAELSSGLGESFATFLASWDVTIIVCILSFVLGLVFLVLLRFCIKPMVYISVLLVFIFMMLSGLVMYVYSYACTDGEAVATGEGECLTYKVSSEDGRRALQIGGYIAWGLGAVYALTICCLWKRIRLAVSINSVAAQFVYQTPHVVLVPVVQGVFSLVWTIVWIAMATFLLSQVPDTYVDTTATYPQYDDAYTSCAAEKYPEGGIYMDDAAGVWKCYLPRYAIDYRFWFSLFSFFWHMAFYDAVGQCTIAGAVGVWFFNSGDKGEIGKSLLSVCTGVKNCFRNHLGSLAMGSFILAVIQTIRWFMVWLSKQAKAQGNKIMEIVCRIFAYCLWCFEKSVKFLNKNAYIQVALLGTNFCVSAKNAFFLILRNVARFGVLGSLGFVVHFIGKLLIMAATAILGLLILEEMHSEVASAPYVCIVMYCVIGYIMGVLFMNVFGLAVDTTLQCFIAVEEMNIDADFIPPKLRKFVDDHHASGDSNPDKHEGCCQCLHGCCG